MRTALVTNASCGLGLEFVKQLLNAGNLVFVGCRHPEVSKEFQELFSHDPERLHPLRLDVEQNSSIARAGKMIRSRCRSLDLLVNCAGIDSRDAGAEPLCAGNMRRTLRSNVAAPLLIAAQFLDLLRAGDGPRIVTVSSRMETLLQKQRDVGDDRNQCRNRDALKAITSKLAVDLHDDGIISVALDPGQTRTDAGPGGLTCEQSVRALLKVIGGLTMKQSGKFLAWDGTELAW